MLDRGRGPAGNPGRHRGGAWRRRRVSRRPGRRDLRADGACPAPASRPCCAPSTASVRSPAARCWCRTARARSTWPAAIAATLRRMRMERIAMVFQQFALLPWRTVHENVSFGLELRGGNRAERDAIVAEKLKLVDLDRWGDKFVHELSRRHAAARRPRPRACHRFRHPADGRALLGPRPADPGASAGRIARPAAPARQDDPVRQPRSQRGPQARQAYRDHGGRPDRSSSARPRRSS